MELHNAPTNQPIDAWKKFRDGDFSSLGALFEKHYLELFYYGNKIVALPEMVRILFRICLLMFGNAGVK